METSRSILKGRIWEFVLIYGVFTILGFVYYPTQIKWLGNQPSTWVVMSLWFMMTYIGYIYPIPYNDWVWIVGFVTIVYFIWLYWMFKKKTEEDFYRIMAGGKLN